MTGREPVQLFDAVTSRVESTFYLHTQVTLTISLEPSSPRLPSAQLSLCFLFSLHYIQFALTNLVIFEDEYDRFSEKIGCVFIAKFTAP